MTRIQREFADLEVERQRIPEAICECGHSDEEHFQGWPDFNIANCSHAGCTCKQFKEQRATNNN